MNDNNNSVDVVKLHEHFMSGEKLIVIANNFGVSEAYIQQLISAQRKINPEKWPKRHKQKLDPQQEFIELLEKEIEFARSINASEQMILGLKQAIVVIKMGKSNP